jgi:prepilin-type N-terminal cleavage/methylation domain-containing protein
MRTYRGFTLVEAIVVIAIITLVAGIAFAAMGPAREAARQGQCVSNLRQIGQAIRMYIDDHGGADLVEGRAMEHWELGLPGSGQLSSFRDSYLKNRELLYCPSYHGSEPIGGLFSTYWWPADDGEGLPHSSRFSEIVRKRGADTPITICTSHNAIWDRAQEPRWAAKKVIALRLDGRVNTRMVSVRDHTANW